MALNPSLGLNCALLVDRLAGLRSSDQLRAAPAERRRCAAACFAGDVWLDPTRRAWQEIDLAALGAQDEHFLAIAA